MGFPDVHFAPEQHELLLRVLAALTRPAGGGSESRHDTFGGDMMFWRYYMCWLTSIGMLDMSIGFSGRLDPLGAGLSREGRSVLMMLQATRDPAWEGLPMADVMDAVAASVRGAADDHREHALQGFERAIGLRRHVFARERVGRSPVVTLTSMPAGGAARMPVRRVTWSMSFVDAVIRDDLFAWLATRVDRWDDWGEMAYREGAEKLTQHLFSLTVASNAPGSSS